VYNHVCIAVAVFTLRTTSYDIGRCRTMSSDIVRHRASRHPALSYDVVRSVNTAYVSLFAGARSTPVEPQRFTAHAAYVYISLSICLSVSVSLSLWIC